MQTKANYMSLILLSAINIAAIAGIAIFNIFHYQTAGVDTKVLIPSGIAVLILFLLIKPLDRARIKARTADSYDEYGRSKKIKTYERMSNKEQAELDRIRLMEMERILPSSVIMEMTKPGSENPEKDMNELIGLELVKEKIEEMAARMSFDRESNVSIVDTAMHMCFFGPPGTGKTTCARIITGFLYQYGYIKKNQIIEVDGNFLADQNASDKTEMLVRSAMGGVLFIDEAYSLLNNYSGSEAIATLLKQMEDNRDKFILILAGYENEMLQLIQSNPGFLSRIKEYFYFKKYTIPELDEIFIRMAGDVGFNVSEQAIRVFEQIMETASKDQRFGNARTVRNVLDKSINRHSLNYKRGVVSQKYTLCPEDIIYESLTERISL